MRISCARLSQPFRSRMAWWARAKDPGGSGLKKTRAHARMKLSWNMRWWKERWYLTSSASSAFLQSCMRLKPSTRASPVLRIRKAVKAFLGTSASERRLDATKSSYAW